jgi:FSR family fosmidomycin resistance protein-like MFS transporter
MGVLMLSHFADALGLPWILNLLAVLPLAAFLRTLFIQEPVDAPKKQRVRKGCGGEKF